MHLMGFLSNLCACLERALKSNRAAAGSFGDADAAASADSYDLFYELHTLQIATNFFSDLNQLGHGGFGPVFKLVQGLMPNGEEIAVKKLSGDSRQGLREFINEVKLLLKIQHKNLVTLLGCCAEGPEKMLVYEYLPNKSLDYFLFDKSKSGSLDWATRYRIVTGVARGLLYLHEEAPERIIHRDIKASNILLDGQLNPKISDFGLARLFPGDDTHMNTFRISGTYGYMAPEYALHGYLSVKTDVFSYGILVLEIVSGRKNHDGRLGAEKADLLNYSSFSGIRCWKAVLLFMLLILDLKTATNFINCEDVIVGAQGVDQGIKGPNSSELTCLDIDLADSSELTCLDIDLAESLTAKVVKYDVCINLKRDEQGNVKKLPDM